MKEFDHIPVTSLSNGMLVFEEDAAGLKRFAYTVQKRVPTLGCKGIHVETTMRKNLCYWNGAKVWVDISGR